MSLTTAISDDDDAESAHASPFKQRGVAVAVGAGGRASLMAAAHAADNPAGSAASFNCTGAVRKAGFLSVKKWLLRKKHQVTQEKMYNSLAPLDLRGNWYSSG